MELVLSMSALSAESLSEHELIDAARDGDDRAFEELYTRYRGRITGFIHARVRDHGRSEDIAQEVFISALRRLRGSSQPIQFKPWIYEIAKNACIDEHRRTRRMREISLDGDDDDADSSRLPSPAPQPPAAVETKQTLTDLRGAFGGLSDSHHQLLVLREFEGLSYDEIGERTGMSRQMVESALFRARRKLTEEYEELASGRRCRHVQCMIDDGRAVSARALGVRERRVLARHLAHCQACRMSAHLAGVDESLVTRRRLGAKIAALLPFPLWRWPWGGGRSRQAVAHAGGHPAVQTLSTAVEPAAATSLGGAAVAAAVLALAGAGAVTAPVATHAERSSTHHAAVRSFAPAHATAPAVTPRASGSGSSAAPHRRVQLGGNHTVTRTGAPSRHPRRGRQTSAGPGGAGSGATIPSPTVGATGIAAPLQGAPVGSTPSALTHASGSDPAGSVTGLASGLTHLAAGVAVPTSPSRSSVSTLPSTVSAGAQATGNALAGASQATAAGATQAAAGVPPVIGAAQGATTASTQSAQATVGAVSHAAGAAGQTAASATAGATNTVASLLHG